MDFKVLEPFMNIQGEESALNDTIFIVEVDENFDSFLFLKCLITDVCIKNPFVRANQTSNASKLGRFFRIRRGTDARSF